MHNTFFFGAGASACVGIPMLGNFIDSLKDAHLRGSHNKRPLSEAQKISFQRAIEVINDLDHYAARVNLDNSNIEDILSTLSFNMFTGKSSDQKAFNYIVDSISRNIDLHCTLKPSRPGDYIEEVAARRGTPHSLFWKAYFKHMYDHNEASPIITLNYDIALEASLINYLSGLESSDYKSENIPINFNVDFQYGKQGNFSIARGKSVFSSKSSTYSYEKTYPKIQQSDADSSAQKILILKPHGSLNFSKNEINTLIDSQENPYIAPPIFNKSGNGEIQKTWKATIAALQSCKHLNICGYSLPKTDTYMRYLFKSALGGNKNLRKINIIDPCADEPLFQERFRECFSGPMQRNVNFINSTFHNFYALMAGKSSIMWK